MRGECGLYRQILGPSFLPEVGQNMQWMDVHTDVALTTVPIFGISCLCLLGLRCCATNRKVAGSIPAGVIGIFH